MELKKVTHVIDALFVRMAAIYLHQWYSAFPTSEAITVAKREWRTSLQHLTIDDIERGIDNAKRTSTWVPSLAKFLELCRLDCGLPDAETAYREACKAAHQPLNHEWQHPVVYQAAKAVGFYELRHYAETQSRPLFQRAYEVIVRRIEKGEVFDAPIPKALPESITGSTPAVAQKHKQIIKNILNGWSYGNHRTAGVAANGQGLQPGAC